MRIPQFIHYYKSALSTQDASNFKGDWDNATSYDKDDVVRYQNNYFKSRLDGNVNVVPDLNQGANALNWDAVDINPLPRGYVKDINEIDGQTIGGLFGEDYYWTGALVHTITGHGSFSYSYKGYQGSSDDQGPEAFHLYNKKRKRLQDWYESPNMATASKDGGGQGITFEYTYKLPLYELCHGTRPLYQQGQSGNFNFYNAFYSAGYYNPPYGENPTLSIIGDDPGIEGQMAELSMLAGELPGGANSCCKEMSTEDKRMYWGIRTTFPTTGPLVSTDVARGQEHAIHAPSEECPPEFPPAYYFVETTYGWHPGSVFARLAGNFYNDNPFPTPLDIDGHAEAHVYSTKKCYGAPLYQGWVLNEKYYPDLAYPTAGSSENKLAGNICNARLLETNTAQGECSSCINIQLGSATGPGAAINDQANFFGYSDNVYWHFTFRYNHDEFFDFTENTSTNQVTQFLGAERSGPNMATQDHYWTYKQCPNTPDYLPWSQAMPIHACPNDYFDVPYYAAIGRFGFYGARFLNKCGKSNADMSSVVEGVASNTEYNYYYCRRLASASNFPPDSNVDDGNWSFREQSVVLRIEKQLDAGQSFTVSNSDETKTLTYKIVKFEEECWVLNYIFSSREVDENWQYQINSTSNSSDQESYCEGDPNASQADCNSYCNPKGRCDGYGNASARHLDFDKDLCEADVCSDGVSTTEKECCENNGGEWENGGCDDGTATWLLGGKWTEITSSYSCQTNGGKCTGTWTSWAVGSSFGEQHEITNKTKCLNQGHDWIDGVWHKRRWVLACDNQPNQSVTVNPNAGGQLVNVQPDGDNSFPRDWPSSVADCDFDSQGNSRQLHNSDTEYVEPPVANGTCSESDYRTLLKIATNEEKIGNFFAGNIGFFLWANWRLIVNSNEWKNELVGEGEEGFKRALSRLKDDYDNNLGSLIEFLDLSSQHQISYQGVDDTKNLFQTGPLTYNTDSKVSEILFDNERYERFLREVSEDKRNNIFCNGERVILAWRNILKDYGHYVASAKGVVNEAFYEKIIKARESRLLTRYIENHNRGVPTDLFPMNEITFSMDHMSGYLDGKHWGSGIYGDTIDSSTLFEKLPSVERRYFQGVYSKKDLITGSQEVTELARQGNYWFYGGVYKNRNRGGDLPRRLYNISADIVGDTNNGDIPRTPWLLEGLGGVGRLDPNFSCFTPIFVQQPLDVACKLGQSPTFRCLAVDYHTIPEDKINAGYPEIDFWVNNLKLADSNGNSIYPLQYQWYRIDREKLDKQDPVASNVDNPVNEGKGDKIAYSVLEWAEPAYLGGNWACVEGDGGRGNTECTLFHPFESVGEGHVDQGFPNENRFLEEAGKPQECKWPNKPSDWSNDPPQKIKPPTGYCNYNAREVGLAGDFIHCTSAVGQCHPNNNPGIGTLWVSGSITMDELYEGADGTTKQYTLTKKDGVVDGKNQYTVGYGSWGWPIECEGEVIASGNGFYESVSCYGEEPGDDFDAWSVNKRKIVFQKGAKQDDENYYYFAVVSGRFGIRRSEYVGVETENWLRTDISVRNGSPANGRLDMSLLVNPWYKGTNNKPYEGYEEVKLKAGLFAAADAGGKKKLEWMGDKQGKNTVMPFAGVTRDPNVAWENTWRSFINMSNNCKSHAPVGLENFRGVTRTYQPPVQSNVRGTQATNASYFEYGLLYPFGCWLDKRAPGAEHNHTIGDLIYGYKHLPTCDNYEMRDGRKGPRLSFSLEGKAIRHYSILDPAVIADREQRNAVPVSQIIHHGELYPWNEMDAYPMYAERWVGFMPAIGTAWQFSNMLGKIPRFGKSSKFPHRTPRPRGGGRMTLDDRYLNDTDEMFFWGGGPNAQLRNYEKAQRLIRGNSLAGENCGWCGAALKDYQVGGGNKKDGSASRFMLYFVEAHQRFYLSCDSKGTKRSINWSYIAPGMRRGSSAIQFFWGGKPHNTFVKREPLYGAYAFEWKTMNHNRDRNGNGICETFYSSKHEREMRLYDPPAIYGLYLKQTPLAIDPKVQEVKTHRKNAFGAGYNIKGTRFGRPGRKDGCGQIRLHCVEEDRDTSIPYVHPLSYQWAGGHIGSMNLQCRYYHYGKNLGIDPPRNYGCNNVQLAAGLCFDPCLSMKYNYGFFPGGKLLALNNYVKYKKSLIKDQQETAGVERYIVQISNNDRYTDVDLDKSQAAISQPITVCNTDPNTFATEQWGPGGVSWCAGGGPEQECGSFTRIGTWSGSAATSGFVKGAGNSVFLKWIRDNKYNANEWCWKARDDGVVNVHSRKWTILACRRAAKKPSHTGFRRIMRGPWLTPYKLIRETAIDKSSSGNLPGLTQLKTYDHGWRSWMDGSNTPHIPNWAGKGEDFEKLKRRKDYITTEVSPCASRGADHCNYLTATIHIGMDSKIVGKTQAWRIDEKMIGGKWKPTEGFSWNEEYWNEIKEAFFGGPNAQDLAAPVDLRDGTRILAMPVPGGVKLIFFKEDGAEPFTFFIKYSDNTVANEVLQEILGGEAADAAMSACMNRCWSRSKPVGPTPTELDQGMGQLSNRELAARAGSAAQVLLTCEINCRIAEEMSSRNWYPPELF